MSAQSKPKTEMITLPSGASYPAFLDPLTKNEQSLLDMYDKIKYYEKEAARLKAEEAKRRLEEADERYRAKVREREKAENGGVSGGEDEEMGDAEDKKMASRKTEYATTEYTRESEEEEEDE